MVRHLSSETTCHGRLWQIIAIFIIFCSCVAPSKIGAQVKPIRRVLIVYELGLSSPSVSVLDQQIRAALEDSSFQIELYREYLETTLFPDPKAQKEIREGLHSQISGSNARCCYHTRTIPAPILGGFTRNFFQRYSSTVRRAQRSAT